MRTKNLLAVVPLPNIVKSLFERITASRIAFFYFVTTLLYCISQLVFQGWAFKINNEAGTRLSDIIDASGLHMDINPNGQLVAINNTLAFLQNNLAPPPPDPATSSLITTSTSSSASASISSSAPSVRPPTPSSLSRPTTPHDDDDDDDDDETKLGGYKAETKRFTKRNDRIIRAGDGHDVLLLDMEVNGEVGVLLSESCVKDIVWPSRTIHNTKREDVTFMAFQIWVMGMSVIALVNESIPHIFAVLVTHILATTWSGFQIHNTREFRAEFQQNTIKAESCNVNLLPDYWSQRGAAEIAVLSINSVFLLSSIFFTHRLVKRFGWQTFKRIGASLEMNRIYKVTLIFSIGLQLAFFCVLASMGLWIDFLQNTPEGQLATRAVLYKVLGIVVCLLVVPWMYLGWTSIRKESKVLMGVFILVSTAMVGGWGGLFESNTFRRTFLTWPFFAGISTASFLFALMCTILGAICLTNFDKGLKHFLNAEEQLPGEDFTPVTQDPEKSPVVQFPSSATFDVAFTISPDRHSPGGGLPTVAEYDQPSVGTVGNTRRPPPARMPSNASSNGPQELKRSGSNGSDYSTVSSSSSGTIRTYAVAGSHHAIMATNQHERSTSNSSNAKRGWVIE